MKTTTVRRTHTTPMPTRLNGMLVLDAHRVEQRPGTLPSFVVLCVDILDDDKPREYVTWVAYDGNEHGDGVEWECTSGHYFPVGASGANADETADAARANYNTRVLREF